MPAANHKKGMICTGKIEINMGENSPVYIPVTTNLRDKDGFRRLLHDEIRFIRRGTTFQDVQSSTIMS